MIPNLTDEVQGRDTAGTHESFQEWLQSVAASEGVSQEEVLDQMMSSYWILSELSEMMGETDYGGTADGPNPTDQQAVSDQHEPDSDQTDAGVETDPEQIIKLANLLNEPSDSTDTPQQGTDPQLVGKLDQLHDDVDRLVNRINRLADGQKDSESTIAADGEEVEELADQVENLEATVTDLAQTVDANEERTEEKFIHVEDILEYLVGRVDEFDKRIDDLANEVTLLASDESSEKPVAELKREANRKEIRTATCEACDAGVDIGLLESVTCPNCNTQFDRLETKHRLFGLQRSHVLRRAPSDLEKGSSTTQSPSSDSPSSKQQSPAESTFDDLSDSDASIFEGTDESK